MAKLLMQEETSTPSTPSSGKWKIYPKSGGIYILDDAGNEIGVAKNQSAGQMLNGKITPTVVANDLILTLQTAAGGTPSASDPVYININGTLRSVTAATTCTLADGTNWFNAGSTELAAKLIDYFAYAVYDSNSSVVAISFARIPYCNLVSEFSATTTNEKHLANYANFTTTDDVCVIGRFGATLSAGAGYTWTVPTFTSTNLIQRPIYYTRELAWTPVFTNLTTTSGTLTAFYMIDKNVIEYHIEFVFGASSSIGGDVSHTVPFTRGSSYGGGAGMISGTLRLQDTGTAGYIGNPIFNTTTAILYRAINAAGTYAAQAALSSTIPHTWATTDEIYETARYFI